MQMKALRHVLERLDLSLNESKTRIVDTHEESFDFLGFGVQMRRSRNIGSFQADQKNHPL
jgi:hypothetical protein